LQDLKSIINLSFNIYRYYTTSKSAIKLFLLSYITKQNLDEKTLKLPAEFIACLNFRKYECNIKSLAVKNDKHFISSYISTAENVFKKILTRDGSINKF